MIEWQLHNLAGNNLCKIVEDDHAASICVIDKAIQGQTTQSPVYE